MRVTLFSKLQIAGIYSLEIHTRMGLEMPGLSRQMLTVAGYGAERVKIFGSGKSE